jgi:hypothetical protein
MIRNYQNTARVFYRILIDQVVVILLFSTIVFITYDHYNFKKTNNLRDKIINSIYFSTITQFTVGYGDVTPQTNIAKITNIIHNFVAYFMIVIEISTV